MAEPSDIVPDSERRGLIGALPSPVRPLASLIRLDRPIGVWLLFWPGAWAIALAGMGGGIANPRGWALIGWFALGAFAMRSAGCVYNDIVDRDLDAQVERTRLRPLASGRTSLKAAWALLGGMSLVGLIVLLQLRPLAQAVALGSLALVAAYPFMKRITWWPQAWLGLVFSWAALVGWPAMTGRMELPALLLYAGSIFWVIGYDTAYALQDKEDDALVGVRSSALALGPHARLGIGICYLFALLLWGAALWQVRPQWLGILPLLPMALHLGIQVARLKPEDGASALATFRSNRFAGLLMFLACLVVGTTVKSASLAFGGGGLKSVCLMLTVDQAEARASALIEAARKAGADAADVLYVGEASTGIQVRLGELEDVGRSEGEEIGLRFFVGSRSASVSSSDLSSDALEALVERAAAMAREAPEDPYAGLAPEDRLFRGVVPDLEADDGGDPAPAELKQRALVMEEAARSVAGITNSEGAGMSAGRSVVALATSHGFLRGYTSSYYGGSASVIAGTGGEMQRDYASHSVRHLADLDAPEELGRRAAERTVGRLNPGKLASGVMPVVFDPRVGGHLVGHLIGAMSGPAIARKTSFLLGREEEALFPDEIAILDDPHRRRGIRSKPFDGEGVATAPRRLVERGRITGWLLNSASARQLGMETTGHATRGIGGAPGAGATNVHLEPGRRSPAELIGDIRRGLYVTEMIGQGVNPVTGDYSRGASGFIIENGEIAGPVAEITVAGNILDMFREMSAANDLEFRRALNVPTLRVEGLTVAGA